ncbi:MAG: hypothetical protein AB7P14_25330 [Blastocatellales bacterium]
MGSERKMLRLLTCLGLLLLLGIGVIASKPRSYAAQQGQIESRQATVIPHPAVRSPLLKEPPRLPEEVLERQMEEQEEHLPFITPIDPSVRPETIRPTSPKSIAVPFPEYLRQKSERNANAPNAPGTFTVYQNDIVPRFTDAAGNSQASTTNEPSLGVNGRVIFYTGNWYSAVSGNRGQTFTYISPFTNFPSVNGGFCCDQATYYERTRGAMFWLLQYIPDNNTNTYRIAVARTQADILNNTWFWYDFTPATFGLNTPPTGATGFWLDFPDLTVSDNFLYFTTNIFPRITSASPGTCMPGVSCTCPGQHPSCTSSSAVVVRIPLTQISQGQNINFNFAVLPHSLRLTQGATGTMYFGTHLSNTQIRIYRWPENTGTIFNDDVNHDAYNTPAATQPRMNAPSPDGTNFAGFADDRVLGAWVANGVIGFMWNAKEGNGFPYPHVQVVRFNESDRSRLSQGQIWQSDHAWLYPSVHPNDRSHLGGTMVWGGGIYYPNTAAWIADDINNGTLTPLENVTIASGNAGPANNRWGDYLTARRNSPYGNTWHGSGFVLNGGTSNNNVQIHHVWFGRERDTPPATNTIYVSLLNTTGYEDGTFLHPYNTVGEGNFAAMPGDVITIDPGNYNERPVLNRASRLQRFGTTGTVKIGQP